MKKFNFYSRTILLSSLAAVLLVGMNAIPAHALVGDVVSTISADGFINPVTVFCSIGISFDGTNLYWDACATGTIWLTDTAVVPAVLDSRDFSADIPELPNAMAFDASRGGNWICTQSSQVGGMPIYFQDFQGTLNTLADDTVTQEFLITVPPAQDFSFFFCDGLAINLNGPGAADDRLYFSDDVNDVTEIYDATGSHIATIQNTLIDPSLSSGSGLAVGGSFLYLANNGGGDVFRADLGANPLQPPLVDQFASGDDRQEDMECDPNTFTPTEVMWVRTTPQGGLFPNVATAFEIEPDTCGLGGGGGNPVGGSILPIDTAALLIAGAFTNAIWMAPVLAGAAGTAALYIKTRKN